jgi:predicted metal-dependent hydrolase
MVARLERKEQRARPSDEQLLARAATLNDTYFGGLATPSSVRWVTNQQQRWGSCSPGDRSIRLSERLQGMPSWVVDYVLVHELAHLLEADHSPRFRELEARYPLAEKARAFLDGAAWAHGHAGRAAADQREPSPS